MSAKSEKCCCKVCQSGFKKLYWEQLYPIHAEDQLQPSEVSLGFQLPASKFDPPQGYLVNENNLELRRTIKEQIPHGYKFSRKVTKVVKPREIVKLLKRPKSKVCQTNAKTGVVACKLKND